MDTFQIKAWSVIEKMNIKNRVVMPYFCMSIKRGLVPYFSSLSSSCSSSEVTSYSLSVIGLPVFSKL